MLTVPSFTTTRQEIAGLAIADLVRQFGTPCYVYDLEKIYRRIEDLAAFDVIRYAQKALSNIGILDRIRQQGVIESQRGSHT